MGKIAHAGATIFFRRGDAEHAELTQFTPKMHGKCVVAVGFSGQRRNAAFRETAHRITKGFDLLAKTEIHAPPILAQSKHTRPPKVLAGVCLHQTVIYGQSVPWRPN